MSDRSINKLLKNEAIIMLAFPFLIVVIGALVGVISLFYDECSPDKVKSLQVVTDHLHAKKMDVSFLHEEKNGDECLLSYIYESPTEHVEFVVIKNRELSMWNFNKRGL